MPVINSNIIFIHKISNILCQSRSLIVKIVFLVGDRYTHRISSFFNKITENMYIDKSIEYTIDIQTYTMTCKKIKLMDIYKYKYTNYIQYYKLN